MVEASQYRPQPSANSQLTSYNRVSAPHGEVAVLGRVDPQASFWDTGFAVGHLVDGDSFYAKLARHGSEIVSDEDLSGPPTRDSDSEGTL